MNISEEANPINGLRNLVNRKYDRSVRLCTKRKFKKIATLDPETVRIQKLRSTTVTDANKYKLKGSGRSYR